MGGNAGHANLAEGIMRLASLDGLTRRGVAGGALVAAVWAGAARAAEPASRIAADSQTALQRLYADQPKMAELGRKAKAILVFPAIVKAGLMIGGLQGDGAMFERGQVAGYYRIAAATYGLQAGAQTYAYAIFFMTDDALDYLKKSKGWAVGSGPSVVMLDEGKAKSMTSTTVTEKVYAVPFSQHGLMAGLGLEGSKISEIHPK
jgi:lipid-binding SYLF domain-containing protein